MMHNLFSEHRPLFLLARMPEMAGEFGWVFFPRLVVEFL